MNLKILASLGVIAVAVSGAGYGTYAFFSDTEQASGNLFTAGDLDLTLNGLDGITGTIAGANLAPGDDASGSILLRNEGSIFTGDAQGHVVNLDICFGVSSMDDLGNPADVDDGGFSAIDFSRWLEVTTLTYAGQNLLLGIGDNDGDGRSRMLSDLDGVGVLADLADPGAGGQSFALGLHFIESGPNHLKRDVASVTMTFFLAQSGEPDMDCAAAAAKMGIPQVAYVSDFNTGEGEGWDSASLVIPTTGSRFLGTFGDESVSLALPSLAEHDTLRIEADLYILSSFDGENSFDGIRLAVDGVPIWGSTFSFFPTIPQCYPEPEGCSFTSPGTTGAIAVNTLGYDYLGTPADAIYRVVFEVPHTAGSASIMFTGTQDEGTFNEAWGLDNVRVTTFTNPPALP